MGRGVDEFQRVQQGTGSLRRKRFVQRGVGVGIQIVHHQGDALGRWEEILFDPLSDAFGPLRGRRVVGDVHSAPVFERRLKQQQIGHAVALILDVVTLGLSRPRRDRVADFLDALHAGFIHADHRMGRIMRSLVHLTHRFHLTHERGVGLRGNAPHALLPGL